MDRLVQSAILLVSVLSLGLNFFFKNSPIANAGEAQAVCSIVDSTCSALGTAPTSGILAFNPGNGMQIIDFQANRTTFGFSDVNFTQPYDPNLANKKVALGCDSVSISLAATVSGITVSDSLGFIIKYGNPNGTNVGTEIFQYGSGTITFKKGANNFNCNLPPSALHTTSLLGTKTLNFNLNDCLIGLGITLQPGDTMRFSGIFVVNPNGPLTPDFKQLPNFQAFAYATQNGSQLTCNTLSETFTLAKSEVVFDFPNTINGLPIGCNGGYLNWRLFVSNNDFTDYFGNELRPATKVDSLVFDFDPGLLAAFEGGDVQVSIPGHPIFGNSYFSIRPLSDFPDGHYIAKFDTLQNVPSLNMVQSYTFDLRLNLTPTCKSTTGSIAGDNIYDIKSKVSYTDRYYAHFIGDGSCANKQMDQANSTVAYNQPPTFTLSSITPVDAMPIAGVATWDLLLCNTSAQSNSGINWLALEDPTGQIAVNSITDITNPGNPIPLSLLSFGQDVFAFTLGINASQCLKLRVAATTTSCDNVPLQLVSGWNCNNFPNAWTPNDASCGSTSLALNILDNSAASFQVTNLNSTSICNVTGEIMNIGGSLTSSVLLSNASFNLKFIWDENGDGIIQTSETILGQQQVTGSINPSNPLIFNEQISIAAQQACQLLLLAENPGGTSCNTFTTSIPFPILQNAGADLSFCDVSSPFTAILGEVLLCDSASYSLRWSAISPAKISYLSDTTSANPILTIDPVDHLGQTLQYVLRTDRLDCGNSSFDTVQVFVPNNLNGVFDEAELLLHLFDCQSSAIVCADISPIALSNYFITDNGLPYLGSTPNCAGGFGLLMSPGFHELIATDTIYGCKDSMEVTVNCTSTDTLQVMLLLGEFAFICLNSNELTGSSTSLTNVCLDGQFVDYQIVNDSCIILLGNLVGQESACFVVCDANGFCDTTVVMASVTHPFQNGLFDTLILGQNAQYCFNPNQLNLPGLAVSIFNLCPDLSGNFVQFSLGTNNLCVDYQAIEVGTEYACISICDNLGNCDTISLNVTVVPGSTVQDTVFVGLEIDSFCLPQGWLPGALISVTDICTDQHHDNVNFTVQGNCVYYTGIEIGVDTACYRFEDVFGNSAIVELQICVRQTSPNYFCDSIFIGQKETYCLDVSEFPNNFKEGSIIEFCPDKRTNKVKLKYNNLENCLLYEGIEEGRDSTCIVYCDEADHCDTTYLCFLVNPYYDPPTLGDDTSSTIKGTPVVVDFLANDTIYGGIVDIYILDPPVSGSVVFNLDNSMTYTPDDPYCARWENFTYVACNPNGCDTALVSIFINCLELTIFTAVSPNNDDVNDVFYIAKIEDFPDNRLWVYNIWGSLVYESSSYKNNWPGTWGADTDLPDGTYYYILEWKDDGVTIVQKGYIEMFR